MKKQIIVIGIILLSIGMSSGCIGSVKFIEDSRLSAIADSIPPPFNVTDNMSVSYSTIIEVKKNNWYSVDVHVEYFDAPWNDKWWGTLWFKEDGSYHFIQKH